MPIKRTSTNLTDRRTQDYQQILQTAAAGSLSAAAAEVTTFASNLLFFSRGLPASVTAAAGVTLVFSVSVEAINSRSVLSYQWQRSTDGVTWVNEQQTTAQYSNAFNLADNNLQLRVLVTQDLRTIASTVCRLSIVAPAAAVSSLTAFDDSTIGAAYLSGLFADAPLDPMNVTKTYFSAMCAAVMFSEPVSGAGIPTINFAAAQLSALLSQPNGVENLILTSFGKAQLTGLFSDAADANGAFSESNNARLFSIAGQPFTANIAGTASANYTYTASNFPANLVCSSAGQISGSVLSDVNFEQQLGVTATHKTTGQQYNLSLLLQHSQLVPISTAGNSALVRPSTTASTGGLSYSGTAAQLSSTEFLLTPNQNNAYGVVNFPRAAIYNPRAYKYNTNKIRFSFQYRIFDGNGADGFSFEFANDSGGPILSTGPLYGASGIRLVFDTYNNSGNDRGIRLYIDGNAPTQIFSGSPRSGTYRTTVLELDFIENTMYYYVEGYAEGTLSIANAAVLAQKNNWQVFFAGACGGANDRHSINNFTVTYS
jgi:hypothetical protein